MNTKVISGLFILTLLATGCITEYNAMLSPNDTKVLFVNGNIIENTDVIFYLSEGFSLNTPDILRESDISDAVLILIGSNGYKSPPAIYQEKGNYRLSVGELEEDVEYGVQILYNGDTYQSTLSKPIHTPEIDSVSWTQSENYGNVFFYVSTQDDNSGSRFFAWDYTEDWEITALFQTRIFFDPTWNVFFVNNSAPYFYCWKKSESEGFVFGSTELLKENRIINQPIYQRDVSSDDRFTMLYCVTINQRAISKVAYEYYQNIKKLNEGMGGLFTPQPLEFVGNISCMTNPAKKVMGYVDISKNTTQKRTFVYSAQITRAWEINIACSTLPHSDGAGAALYKDGFRPVGDADPRYADIVPEKWARDFCSDCTAAGGTKVKPDFWPNDHR